MTALCTNEWRSAARGCKQQIESHDSFLVTSAIEGVFFPQKAIDAEINSVTTPCCASLLTLRPSVLLFIRQSYNSVSHKLTISVGIYGFGYDYGRKFRHQNIRQKRLQFSGTLAAYDSSSICAGVSPLGLFDANKTIFIFNFTVSLFRLHSLVMTGPGRIRTITKNK